MLLEQAGQRWLKLATNLLWEGKEQITSAYEVATAVAQTVGNISLKTVSAIRVAFLKAQELDYRYKITENFKNYVLNSAQIALEILMKECQRLVLALAEQTSILQEVQQELAKLRAELADHSLTLQEVTQKLSTLESELKNHEQSLSLSISVHQEVNFLGKQISELIDLKQTIEPITESLGQRITVLENRLENQKKRSSRKKTAAVSENELTP